MWSQLLLGNNALYSPARSAAVISALGKPLVKLERGENDEQLLASVDLYDRDGQHVGMLRRNAWPFAHSPYRVTTNPGHLLFSNGSTGDVVLAARVLNTDVVAIDYARFYTSAPAGQPGHYEITIHPEQGVIIADPSAGVRTATLAYNSFEGNMQMIAIDDDGGIAIGRSNAA